MNVGSHPPVEPCEHCSTWQWCVRNACVGVDESSARRLAHLEARSRETNKEIDELEVIFGPIEPK